MTSSIVVHAGPSRPLNTAYANVDWRPPAKRRDLLPARLPARAIVVLLDAAFLHVAPPSHTELMQCLSAGVPIIGASSFGALRAVELRAVGMLGVGRIFQALCDGLITDDSDLAVAMSCDDFRALTVPLVTIRCACYRALRRGLDEPAVRAAFDAASGIYFAERTVMRLSRVWSRGFPSVCAELLRLVASNECDAKAQDAADAIRYAMTLAETPLALPSRLDCELVDWNPVRSFERHD